MVARFQGSDVEDKSLTFKGLRWCRLWACEACGVRVRVRVRVTTLWPVKAL